VVSDSGLSPVDAPIFKSDPRWESVIEAREGGIECKGVGYKKFFASGTRSL